MTSIPLVSARPVPPIARRTRGARPLLVPLGTIVGCLLAIASPIAAQLITIKTLPIAEGDQFNFFPSANAGMAGASIAIRDTLLDPFLNPAKAAWVRRGYVFGSPTLFSISRDAGGGRTLPLGGLLRMGSTFAGISLALQQIERPRPTPEVVFGPRILDAAPVVTSEPPFPPGSGERQNRFAYGTVGRVFQSAGLSLAASILWNGLEAMDGVDQLYAGSRGVAQDGESVDMRFGVLKEWGRDESLELVVLHNRFSMTHDVGYVDGFWDPTLRTFVQRSRVEQNIDRTTTWGAHLAYARPVGDSGWRMGGTLTANRFAHPKIPNYEIQQVMSIPRDPGYSSAYNIGTGLAKVQGPMAFAVDFVFEPIWSHTWAEAEEETPVATGGTIPAGGMTIENRFVFRNAMARMGVSREMVIDGTNSRLRVQAGVNLRSISYHLRQKNHIQVTERELDEGWLEWMPAWGLSLRFPEIEVRYFGRTTNGTGRPGVAPVGGGILELASASAGRSVLAAPSGPVTLDGVHVTTHQLSFSIPIR